jgi:hypothetical protein
MNVTECIQEAIQILLNECYGMHSGGNSNPFKWMYGRHSGGNSILLNECYGMHSGGNSNPFKWMYGRHSGGNSILLNEYTECMQEAIQSF